MVERFHEISPAKPNNLFVMDPSSQGESTPFVFDISSDEDRSGLLDYEVNSTGSGGSIDWLSDYFREEVAAPPGGGGSDEVVVVKEDDCKSTSKDPPLLVVDDDDDDDDCVILDSDPDKPVAASDGSAVDGSSDDLLIVGETGQVACRDYPHSRHLCVKFPFSTTLHEKHCYLCHCYVCDSPAPCIYWGTGVLNSDHCHATDGEELWRVRRKQSREGKTSSARTDKRENPALPQFTPTPLPLGPCHIVANSIPNNCIGALNPCSASTTSRFLTSNVPARNSLHPHLVHPRLISGTMAQNFRAHKNGSQLMPQSVAFKRFGPARTSFSIDNSSQKIPSQHAWNVVHNHLNPVFVQNNLTIRHDILPCAMPTPYINSATFPPQPVNISSSMGPSPPLSSEGIYRQPPTHPVTANATCQWSNNGQSFSQPLLPVEPPGGNGGQSQTCQLEPVIGINSQSAVTKTAAEIESWLLDDEPCQDIEGTHLFNFDFLE